MRIARHRRGKSGHSDRSCRPFPRPAALRVLADFPGRAVAGRGALLEVLDLGVAHAVEVIVRRVELPHMIDAEAIISPSWPRPLGARCVPASCAALPLACGASRRRRLRLVLACDPDAVEIFRVEFHRREYDPSWASPHKGARQAAGLLSAVAGGHRRPCGAYTQCRGRDAFESAGSCHSQAAMEIYQ